MLALLLPQSRRETAAEVSKTLRDFIFLDETGSRLHFFFSAHSTASLRLLLRAGFRERGTYFFFSAFQMVREIALPQNRQKLMG